MSNNLIALICLRCGAPMKARDKCEYCGTQYDYIGPRVPETPSYPFILDAAISTTLTYGTTLISTDQTFSTGAPGYYYGGTWYPVFETRNWRV